MGRLRELAVPVPPLKTQIAFARVFREIELQKTKLSTHYIGLDILFSSLQHLAFRGEL